MRASNHVNVEKVREGDFISWVSQYGGKLSRHEGTVVLIVPPGVRPPDKIEVGGKSRKKSSNYWGAARNYTSFVVWANDNQDKQLKLYWPYPRDIDWNYWVRKSAIEGSPSSIGASNE